MDRRKKKIAIDLLEIEFMKCEGIVQDVINQLDDEDFDNDYKITIALERAKYVFKDLLGVIDRL